MQKRRAAAGPIHFVQHRAINGPARRSASSRAGRSRVVFQPGVNGATDSNGTLYLVGRDTWNSAWIGRWDHGVFFGWRFQGGVFSREIELASTGGIGRVLSWEQAIAEFRDATGRPGPSTWEVSDYPRGHEDFPGNGVSWYEAGAYAEFAKKQIRTVPTWDFVRSRG